MPAFKQVNTKRVELPSTKDDPEADRAVVVVKERLKLKDLAFVRRGTDETERALNGLSVLIVDWNYIDPTTNKKVPVNPQTIGELEIEDFELLADELSKAIDNTDKSLSNDEKKTLSDTLTPPTPAVITPIL